MFNLNKQLRVLGIAPYEGMKTLMSNLAEEYPQIDLTLFVGDLEQGVQIAKANFHGNYDVVISRGGTAKMLQQQLSLPVIEIEVSMYDILCALKLADGLTGKTAMVSFANITGNAKLLCDLLHYDVDIYTIEVPGTVESTLRHLSTSYKAILCDMVANTTAKRLGLNSFLITSGTDSIRWAFDRALQLSRSLERLSDENQFFREVIRGQIGETIIFDNSGQLFFSTMDDPGAELMEMLYHEMPGPETETEQRIIRNLGGMLYSIRIQRIISGSLSLVAFFFAARKTPLSPNQTGIRFSKRQDAENAFYRSIFSFAGTIGDVQDDITRINQSTAPVVIAGEDGTGKENVVSVIYMRSSLQNNPLISINCSLLNDKSWAFLLEHHNSPLADENNTIYFSSIDVLSPERRHQLLDALSEMNVCRRNRIIFSCICQPGEFVTSAGSEFMDKLCCLSLYLQPLRSLQERISSLVNLSLSHLNVDLARPIVGVEPEAMQLLNNFPWPHNYTQFRRVLGELAVTASGQTITADNTREILRREKHFGFFSPGAENAAKPLDLSRTLDEINRDVAFRVLEETRGNQTAAAKRLGISRTTLWRLTREQ